METREIPGRIQMEQFITVEIFRNKSNTFRGITFFPFLPSFLFSETFSSPVSFVRNFLPKFPYKWKALQELVSHDPPLRLSPVPTRFSRNIFRFAFLTILDSIKLQMYVNNEVGNYMLQFPPIRVTTQILPYFPMKDQPSF